MEEVKTVNAHTTNTHTLLKKKKHRQVNNTNNTNSSNTNGNTNNSSNNKNLINKENKSSTEQHKAKSHKKKNKNKIMTDTTTTAKPIAKPEESKFYQDEFVDEKKPDNKNLAWVNKQRTMVVSSRGVSHSERYTMNDLIDLLPHAKKECKIEKNIAKTELNEICYNHDCKNCIYFEHRKREFLMWLFRSPDGPCVKFQIRNVHTVSDIRLLGNCLKYSRPFLSFDKSFDEKPHLKLLKEMFTHAFNTPKNHPKSKPFFDHVLCLYNINNNIFFRNYQILNELKEKFTDTDDTSKLQLVEIGPRFALTIIKIFDGPLGGKTLYSNPAYIPPSVLIRKNNNKYISRRVKEEKEKDEIDHILATKKDNPRKWLEE